MNEVNIITSDSEELYNADKAVKDFVKSHGRTLDEEEREELGNLLRNRADAISNVLGVKVASVADDI